MPTLLRYDTIRLLEASIESLQLAVGSLGSQKRIDFRQPTAEYSIEVGLIGAAAELSMAACLIQAYGPSVIQWPSGKYKTAAQILAEFRTMLKDAPANSAFITRGVQDAVQHRNELLRQTISFRRLFPVRAAALHAGRGLLHEATVVQSNDVADFLELLKKSSKISPYIPHVPRCRWYVTDKNMIVEDLARRLRDAQGEDRVTALASLYLVLPDIPEEDPDWLEAFERLATAPRQRDITYLLDALETAVPVSLRRIAGAGDIIPVAYRPQNADALPIAPQFLRRQFNEIPELWHADVATANGRLEAGSLDLPPAEAVRVVFALGLVESNVLRDGDDLSAHASWAPIAASLSVPGTPGPYWFLIRKTSDLGQLRAQLERACALGNRSLRGQIEEALHGVEAIRERRQLTTNDRYFGKVITNLSEAESSREGLVARQERQSRGNKALPNHLVDSLVAASEGGQSVGLLLTELIAVDDIPDECLRYWCRILAEASVDREDTPALVSILAMDRVTNAHTAARKALRRIDFALYGPSVETAT